MPLNSVNTNLGAQIALESLNTTNAQLQATQKRISTGYRVADATDDGAAFAVAQKIRSSVSGLTTANQELGNVQGLLTTTTQSLTSVSDTANKQLKSLLVSLSSGSVAGDTRTQDIAQYNELMKGVKSNIQGAGYNGKTLVGNLSGSLGTFSGVNVVKDDQGGTYGIATFGGSAFFGSLSFNGTTLGSATAVAALLTTGGTFTKKLNALGTALNTYGTVTTYVTNQVTYNSNKIDALNSGLGSLVDADLSKEAANLQALQTRQQLGTQALSIANQAPQSLLSLFK